MVVVAGNQPDVPIAGLAAAQAAASPATVNAETVQAASSEPEGMIVKSPLVGTFMQHRLRMQIRLFLLVIR